MNLANRFAYDINDTESIRTEKYSIFLVAGATSIAGVLWSIMYYIIFGWGLTSFLPLSFSIIVGISLILSHTTRKHRIAIGAQIFCITYITAIIQWSIGSLTDSGLVLLWAFLGPITALMFYTIRQAIIWFALFLLNIAITLLLPIFFTTSIQAVSYGTRLFFTAANLSFASTIVFAFSSYYVNRAIKEQKRTSQLLETNLQQEVVLRQSKKLASLGQMSAGMAHELNNPASAALRGTEQLRKAIQELDVSSMEAMREPSSADQLSLFEKEINLIRERAKAPLEFDPIEQADRENQIESWLNEQGIDEAWQIAPVFVRLGYDKEKLVKFTGKISREESQNLIKMLSNRYIIYRVLEEIGEGTLRISDIVKSLKSYSYMDQAPMQSVDVNKGLKDTLTIFSNKLKIGVNVIKEFDPELPHIEAYGSELNQVWTNLIDNAIAAIGKKGTIHIKTYQATSKVIVEITDDGPGIPPDIQSKIFDPFFTTKNPGEGTGLGLNISHSIITQKHKGSINVESVPGETRFKVELPMSDEISDAHG